MNITNDMIAKSVQDFFTLCGKELKDDLIKAFIPFGGIHQIPSGQFQTFAFEDEVSELVDFLREYSCLMDQFNCNPKQKTRIFVQMYCRIIENDFQYLIIYNLLRLLKGLHTDWQFETTQNGKKFFCENPNSKIDEICKLCKSNKLTIGKVLKNLLKADLRNSFYHSQYSLLPNGTFINTRVYSPASTYKPSKEEYGLTEIESLYSATECFFDNFFNSFYAELDKFKNGKCYTLEDGKTICWDDKNKRWIFLPS